MFSKANRPFVVTFYYVQVLLNAVRSLNSLQKRLLNAVTSLCSICQALLIAVTSLITVCKHCSMLSLPDIHCMQALLNAVASRYSLYASTAQSCHFPISTICKHCLILSHLVYNIQALLLLVTIRNIQIYLKCHIPVITFILIFKFTDELIDYID